MSDLPAVEACKMICRMSIWLKSIHISGLSNISVLMDKWHSKSCILIYRICRPCVSYIIRCSSWFHCRIVKWSCSCDIITSLIDSKIVCVDSWPWIHFVKHEVIRPKNLFNKCWIICTLNFARISTIPQNWLRWKIFHIDS